jgi:hypothetical protein
LRQAYDYWQDQPGNCFVNFPSVSTGRNTAYCRELHSERQRKTHTTVYSRFQSRGGPVAASTTRGVKLMKKILHRKCTRVMPWRPSDSLVNLVTSHCTAPSDKSNSDGTKSARLSDKRALGVSNHTHDISSSPFSREKKGEQIVRDGLTNELNRYGCPSGTHTNSSSLREE